MSSKVTGLEPPPEFPGHVGGVWAPKPCTIVGRWPVGFFAENLAVSSAGEIFISLHSERRIDRFDPKTSETMPFAQFSVPVAGLSFDAEGALWATGGEVGSPPGKIWRLMPDGQSECWVEIPDALFMNGCTIFDKTLLACESLTGRVLRINLETPRWDVWLEDEYLRPANPNMPGANGVKLRDGFAYISVTDRDEIIRVAVASDGSATKLERFQANLRADDFAFGRSGALYIATHPANTVLRLDPDGQRTTIAGPREGLVGATACAFGRGIDDALSLYVTTNGGLYGPFEGVLQEAKLVRIEVGEPGL